jgi:ATP-dependent Lon protease
MLMEESAVEASVVKHYLEDLSMIPYSIKSEEVYDLDSAEKALDEDHYGMKDVKEAILQIIAVGKLKGSLKGKIFCLVGGPGVGKTTIARSISKALGRKFYSISLGGVTDSSVLKGHRRTYIGAYSGKIIEALKECQTNNPVILLDEIDKMGSSYQGDPRSELL